MKKALLVIDVQPYFAIENADMIPRKVASHIEDSEYDKIVFVTFRNDPESNFHKLLDWKGSMNPPDTDLHPELQPYVEKGAVFEKTTYSALKAPGLQTYLQEHDITEIDLCGISIDACVLATAYEAFDLGYRVAILDNLCGVSSFRDDYRDAAMTIIGRNLRRKEVRFKDR